MNTAAETLQAIDNYYRLPEVSNSDLSWLKLTMLSTQARIDFENAYRLGSLVDAMITEPARVNYFTFTLDDEVFTPFEFYQCEQMKAAFKRDEFCMGLLKQSTGQMVMRETMSFDYGNFEFFLRMRCKYDLYSNILKWGGDIKSTTATTQKQFEEVARHFDYDRQRACYMKISGAKRDMLIGISKVNNKIFKIPILRGDELFTSGEKKLTELAFRWWVYFEDFGMNRNIKTT